MIKTLFLSIAVVLSLSASASVQPVKTKVAVVGCPSKSFMVSTLGISTFWYGLPTGLYTNHNLFGPCWDSLLDQKRMQMSPTATDEDVAFVLFTEILAEDCGCTL